MEREATKLEINVFDYLNFITETGVTNMFGATPYIQEKFGLDRKESQRLLMLWMENFNPDGDYKIIKDKNFKQA